MRVTALRRAGPVRWNHTRYPLRDIDDDYNLVGCNRYTEHMVPAFDDHIDVLTSCRVGPVHAGGGLGMHELPISGDPLISRSSDKRTHCM